MEIPTLSTSRLLLRPFDLEDVEPLHTILAQKDVLRYFPNRKPPERSGVGKFIAGQLRHWAAHGFGWWAVELKGNKGLIGWNGLQYLPETEEIEVAYLLSRAYWGQGLATEGAKASLSYGFEQLKLESIVAIVHREHVASQRVVKKLGINSVHEAHYFGMDVYRYLIQAPNLEANKEK